jgi:D-3-phosphoglycerate dehydrogenase
VALIDHLPPARVEAIRALAPAGLELIAATADSPAHRHALVTDVHAIITGQLPVDDALIAAAPRLKMIHKWGVGVDAIALDAARRRGIVVARTTGSNAVPVAEFTLGLMIAALRHIGHAHQRLKQGEWLGGRMPFTPRLLSGRAVGLVGYGAIGAAVRRLLTGFGCTVLVTRQAIMTQAQQAAEGVRQVALPELLSHADVVSLHCPLTDATRGLIGAVELAQMKPGTVLVNVARGGVVDEAALIAALRSGHLLAAATDVFETEPLPADSPLLAIDNLIVTPHLAAIAADTFAPTVRRIFANIAAVAAGGMPPDGDVVA